MNLTKASWRTTVGGIIAFLFLVVGQVKYEFDDKPETRADWNVIIAACGVLWTGLVARDNSVTSEQAGAR